MRKVLMSGAAFLTSSVTLTGEEIESLAPDESLKDMEKQLSLLERYLNELPDKLLGLGVRTVLALILFAIGSRLIAMIRHFIRRAMERSSASEEAAQFLKNLVQAGYNLFICGGTGSGKTTFLNAMSGFIPNTERVITIEDSAELQIRQVPNLVRLETRNANGEGEGAIEISDLIRAALRMRPDRIIVGEVRGKECLDMLQALNTGHAGSLSTGHGNSPRDMLSRLETMTLMGADLPLAAVRSQISSAIDILVHLGRLRDKSRRVLEIAEVGAVENGIIQLNSLFRFQEEEGSADEERKTGRVRGKLVKTGTLQSVEKLKAAGYPV